MLASGPEQVRTGPWRVDTGVAFLAPAPDGPPLSPAFLGRCLGELAGRGFTSVVTAALGPRHRDAFLGAGFVEHERLLLLTHDLANLPPPATDLTRRARSRDRQGVLAIDAATFPEFWRFDGAGLQQAVAATRSARFRVVDAVNRGAATVAGYAVTGLDGREGYMQRLAVAPGHQRRGLGRALALDGLHWLRRKRATRALVNTQTGNDAAFSLYVSVGFRMEAADLVVLRRELAP